MIQMCSIDVEVRGKWLLYRVVDRGRMIGEYLISVGCNGCFEDIIRDHERARNMGIGCGTIPETTDGENLCD